MGDVRVQVCFSMQHAGFARIGRGLCGGCPLSRTLFWVSALPSGVGCTLYRTLGPCACTLATSNQHMQGVQAGGHNAGF